PRPPSPRPCDRRASVHRSGPSDGARPQRLPRRRSREVGAPLRSRARPGAPPPWRRPDPRRRERRDRHPTHLDRDPRVSAAHHPFGLPSRAAGGAALLLSSASVVLGLMMSSSRQNPNRRDLRTLHEALSVTALAMVGLHGVALLGDSYLNPGLAGI